MIIHANILFSWIIHANNPFSWILMLIFPSYLHECSFSSLCALSMNTHADILISWIIHANILISWIIHANIPFSWITHADVLIQSCEYSFHYTIFNNCSKHTLICLSNQYLPPNITFLKEFSFSASRNCTWCRSLVLCITCFTLPRLFIRLVLFFILLFLVLFLRWSDLIYPHAVNLMLCYLYIRLLYALKRMIIETLLHRAQLILRLVESSPLSTLLGQNSFYNLFIWTWTSFKHHFS